ncbi:PE family protein [Mycobacterium sp. E2462]|uniref:PE family protein n=1 Tax=Mycobacterium sp. E2462 TaxID=1834133 RepID=UPI0007FE2E9A|nr:PE family protein [Mycobacterium sp. E2462]OBI07750.1 PE family protein [Mycobacterium sp. E2462]
MSILSTQPVVLDAVADQLLGINAVLREASCTLSVPTTGVVPAAADVVSILTAAQFSWHARLFHELSAEAATVRDQLATTLGVSAGSYAATELANAAALG